MRVIFSIIFTLVVICAFHFTNFIALKYYPAFINLLVFFIFFSSTFTDETIIQKFAKMMEGNKELPDIVKDYTRKLTYVWCVFLMFNFLVSFATIFMSAKVWTIYNGFVSYMLTGLLFTVEYIIRIRFKRKHNV